jgi:3-hydroxymyristoyl/3-hydroxydecanoyl-(acyl carrier protein) dehydratase
VRGHVPGQIFAPGILGVDALCSAAGDFLIRTVDLLVQKVFDDFDCVQTGLVLEEEQILITLQKQAKQGVRQ